MNEADAARFTEAIIQAGVSLIALLIAIGVIHGSPEAVAVLLTGTSGASAARGLATITHRGTPRP